ncbi:hypothetical protein CJP74_00425, partial [Psittacicella melopsittaci]
MLLLAVKLAAVEALTVELFRVTLFAAIATPASRELLFRSWPVTLPFAALTSIEPFATRVHLSASTLV